MEQLSRLLPSGFTRFNTKENTDSDSEAKKKENIEESYPPTDQPVSKDLPQNSEGQNPDSGKSDKEVYENMAYVVNEGEKDKGVGSSFLKSFNDFMKIKLPFDNKDEDPESTPNSTTCSSEDRTITIETSNGSEAEPNYSEIMPSDAESQKTVPEVKTVITEPEPDVPAEKSKKLESSPKASRRNTENVLFFEGATLSPTLDLRRRHSTDVVTVPRPINEELIQEDLKKRGSPQQRKISHDQIDGCLHRNKGSIYSPRSARKKLEGKGNKHEERRPTLAELAKTAGYEAPPVVHNDNNLCSQSLMASHEHTISGGSDDERDSVHTGNLIITGELYLTLEYCIKTNTFSIHVHSANNLAAADPKKESSDPYVKTYLLPDKKSKKKTKTIKDNLNPEYDEVLKYIIGYDELLTRTLCISVWNDRFGPNEFLGEVLVHMSAYAEAGNSLETSQAKWYRLCEKTNHDDPEFISQPEIILSLKYVTTDKVKKKSKRVSLPTKGELHIHIMEAKNLPGKDADGMSDPFCKMSLLPDKKGKTKHKTAIIKRSLNPSWDYNLMYEELSQDDLRERVLEISVWDHDIASRDEFLGGLRLGLGTSDFDWDDANEDEAQIWHTMLTRPNVWIQVVVPLRPGMESTKHS